MNGSVLEAECHHAAALPVLHEQVEGEVLDEVITVVLEGLAVQGVEEGVASAVSHTAAPSGRKCVFVCVYIVKL